MKRLEVEVYTINDLTGLRRVALTERALITLLPHLWFATDWLR